MFDCTPVTAPMNPSADSEDRPESPKNEPLRELYASSVGSLMFLAIARRPDIASTVRKLAVFVSRPGQAHWITAKRVLRYLKGAKTLGIVYVKEHDFDA